MFKSELIAGIHAVSAAMRRNPVKVLEVWIDRGRRDKRLRALVEQARRLQVSVKLVDPRDLDQRSAGVRHQGAIALVQPAERLVEGQLLDQLGEAKQPPLLLVLDGITDPHNFGACLRTADATGVDAVVVPKDRAVGVTPTVRKVACGAVETVPIVQVTNLVRTLGRLKEIGVWVVGTSTEASTSLYEADLQAPVALAMGNEERGLRRLSREACDVLVQIPMLGSVESLNISVAAAVCLFEAIRQRQR